jgi:hypothetical protein
MTQSSPAYRYIALLLCFSCFMTARLQAQTPRSFGANDTIQTQAVIYQGDTISFYYMELATIKGRVPAHMREQVAKWTRLRNAVYVTYPYAITAATIFNDINAKLSQITDKGARRRYIKSREAELKREFTDKLKNLSVYQGKVLMKLIYRETGDHCYEIIKELKGGATARLWQTVAFVFGSNLKQSYNPTGEDADMEKIVKEVARVYGRG